MPGAPELQIISFVAEPTEEATVRQPSEVLNASWK
jgi:hypothetical protein